MNITNNPLNLTEAEKQALKTAKQFAFTYGVGLIFIKTETQHLTWDCSNSVAAKEYLLKAGVKELT